MSNGDLNNGDGFIPASKPLQTLVDGRDPKVSALESTLIYAPYMAASMRERLQTCRKQHWQLFEEVALTKLMCQDAVRVYFKSVSCVESHIESGDVEKLTKAQAVVAAAGAYLYACIDKVASISQAAWRISQREGGFDINLAQQLVFNVVKVIDNEFQRETTRLSAAGLDPYEFSNRIAGLIDANTGLLEIENGNATGTSLTPDAIAEELYAMDATIPYVQPNEVKSKRA